MKIAEFEEEFTYIDAFDFARSERFLDKRKDMNDKTIIIQWLQYFNLISKLAP